MGGPRAPPGAPPGTRLCDSLYPRQPQARVGRVRAGLECWLWTGAAGLQKAGRQGPLVKRRMGDGSWLGTLGGVTPGAPQTLRQPPQPILTQEQVSEENVTPWVLRRPCPSPDLSFPIGKAEGGKPRLGTGCPPGRGELEGPQGSWALVLAVAHHLRAPLQQTGCWPRLVPSTGQVCEECQTDAPPAGRPGV